jgi:hypothetical protein
MKRFRLSTLMLLVVIAGLACALALQNIRRNRELRARQIEASRRELEAWSTRAQLLIAEEQLRFSRLQQQVDPNVENENNADMSIDYGDPPKGSSETEHSKREKAPTESPDPKQ